MFSKEDPEQKRQGENDVDALVIAAHPDDAEFGSAGTVARWTAEGKKVAYVVCTSGEKGTSDPDMTSETLAAIREKEQVAAARVVGVETVEYLRYPDQGIEDTAEFRKEIVRVIRKYRPYTVLTSDPYRRYVWHRDHRVLGQVVADAVFPFARDHLAYPDLIDQGYPPHKVREMYFWGAEDVNFRSDVSDTFELKIKALFCHESQMKEIGKSAEIRAWVEERCRKAAEGVSFELAEGFHHVPVMY